MPYYIEACTLIAKYLLRDLCSALGPYWNQVVGFLRYGHAPPLAVNSSLFSIICKYMHRSQVAT